MTVETKKNKGFANFDPAYLRECSRKGGIKAHETGTAHQWTSEEARVAGSKGGKARAAKKTP